MYSSASPDVCEVTDKSMQDPALASLYIGLPKLRFVSSYNLGVQNILISLQQSRCPAMESHPWTWFVPLQPLAQGD